MIHVWFPGKRQIMERLDHLHDDIIELHRIQNINLGVDMGQNEDLAEIVANQNEANAELAGLPAQVVQLLEQVEAGQPVDPAILATALEGSRRLAGVVPGTPVEPSPENPAPVTPAPIEPVETPTPDPVDPAAEPEQPLQPVEQPKVETPVEPAVGLPAATVEATNPVVDAAAAADARIAANDAAGRLPG